MVQLYELTTSFYLGEFMEIIMGAKTIGGFNTTLQEVEERYAWINEMIKSRQELVLKYMNLLKAPEHDDLTDTAQDRPSPEAITAFCEHLVDYISHGHFDLYPKIVELLEKSSSRSLSIAHRVMPKIDATTDFLLRFNDRYADDMDERKYEFLMGDLAKAGEKLELRFKSEDRLIIGLRILNIRATVAAQAKAQEENK